jgi:hypothetical protein
VPVVNGEQCSVSALLLNISGSQLFDYLSKIISLCVKFTNINSCTATTVHLPPDNYHVIFLGKRLAHD